MKGAMSAAGAIGMQPNRSTDEADIVSELTTSLSDCFAVLMGLQVSDERLGEITMNAASVLAKARQVSA